MLQHRYSRKKTPHYVCINSKLMWCYPYREEESVLKTENRVKLLKTVLETESRAGKLMSFCLKN